MTNRIDLIGQNGATGEHYLVELVARTICGDDADQALMGKSVGKKRWQLHIQQAIRVIEVIRDWDEME